MNHIDEMIRRASEIRKRLLNPPNAVPDYGIDLTRKSTAYRGDTPPPGTPVKKKLNQEAIHPVIKLPIKFGDILSEVCSFYDKGPDIVRSRDRRKEMVKARRVVTILALKLLHKRSVSSIARELGQDHTTTLHARNMIQSMVDNDPDLRKEVGLIEDRIITAHRLRSITTEPHPA